MIRHNVNLDSVVRTNTVTGKIPAGIGKRLHAGERVAEFTTDEWYSFLATLTQEDIINYPDDSQLKATLAKYHHVEAENIMLFSGADGVMSCAVSCFGIPGSQILTPELHFPMYDVYAQQQGCKLNLLKYNGLDLTAQTTEVTNDVSMILVANPNSPVGDSMSLGMYHWFESFKVPIVVDSVYGLFGRTYLDINEKIEKNYIFTFSFSKGFGGAGLRIGYAVANKEIIQILNKMRPMFAVTGVSLKFAQWSLGHLSLHLEYVAQVVAARKVVQKVYPWNIGGNWVHVPQEKYFDAFTNAGLTFKVDCRLPNVTEEALIRISASPEVVLAMGLKFP